MSELINEQNIREEERQRCVDVCMGQFEYWRKQDSTDPMVTSISIGAMGAAANILAGVLGFKVKN